MKCLFCCSSKLVPLKERFYCEKCLVYFRVVDGELEPVYLESREVYCRRQTIRAREIFCSLCVEVEESKHRWLSERAEAGGKAKREEAEEKFRLCKECVARVNEKLEEDYAKCFPPYMAHMAKRRVKTLFLLALVFAAFLLAQKGFLGFLLAAELIMSWRRFFLRAGALCALHLLCRALGAGPSTEMLYFALSLANALLLFPVKRVLLVRQGGNIDETQEAVRSDISKMRISGGAAPPCAPHARSPARGRALQRSGGDRARGERDVHELSSRIKKIRLEGRRLFGLRLPF